MFRILIILIAIVSTIPVDAQNEVIGGCVKKDEKTRGINVRKHFHMPAIFFSYIVEVRKQ